MRREKNHAKCSIANNAYDVLMKRKTKVIFLDMPQSNQLHTKFPGQRINVRTQRSAEVL